MRPRRKEMALLGQVTGREGARLRSPRNSSRRSSRHRRSGRDISLVQRLIDALAAGSDLRLTLVDAPTGYGKTMLVAAWCAEVATRERRVISWLSLAATEDDPALLTRYLIGALRRAAGSLGERAEAMLQVPGASPTAWMRSLVNDLAVVQAEITLVLDDYHAVTEPACHALVQFLLDHAPNRCT